MNQIQPELSQRWDGFDILKTICTFLVISVHAPFPGQLLGVYLKTVARIAVPVFFLISGFFYQNTVDRNREKKQIKKIAALFIKANLLFLVWKLFLTYLSDGSMTDYLRNAFSKESLFEFLVLNESPFHGHLWYLGAILYVLVIVYVFYHLGWMKVLYCAIPFLLFGDHLFGKYSIVLLGKSFPYIYVRNFLFVGLPFFCMGMLIFHHKEEIAGIFGNKWFLAFLIVLFSATTLLERYLLIYYDCSAKREFYISFAFLSPAVFVLFMTSFHRKLNGFEAILAKIGREYSTYIYIIHPIWVKIFTLVLKNSEYKSVYLSIRPIVIYTVSLGTAALFQKLVTLRKNKVTVPQTK